MKEFQPQIQKPNDNEILKMMAAIQSDNTKFMQQMKDRQARLQELLSAWKIADLPKVMQKLNDWNDPQITYEFLSKTFSTDKHHEFLSY